MRMTDEMAVLCARLDDLCVSADKGELSISPFLSPKERHYAEMHLKTCGVKYICFGGYGEAERQRIYILPEYLEEAVESASQLEEYGFSADISCVKITPSGYRQLSHRDYMGSVLGLGVERTVVGDILIYGDGSAVVICDDLMCDFFTENLCKVANDKVKVSREDLKKINIPERKFSEISDTVASSRIDCIVASLCSVSREKAKDAVEAGIVEVDYECEERADREIKVPCIISVRGYGKFEVLSVNDKTKKGRYRLIAKKYL